jgi:uncharacterized protein YbjT (DUF2867 family)
MENFTGGLVASMVKQGDIYLAAVGGKTSFISVTDIAEVVASAFQKSLFGKEPGPEALDYTTVASILSKVTGKRITYHPITEQAMLQAVRDNGLPESAVQYIGVLYGTVRAGHAAAATGDVEAVMGKRPRTFEAFARENAAAWR